MLIDFRNPLQENYGYHLPFEKEVADFITDWFSENKTTSVKTSGSTGVPKIFQVEKEKMKASANMTCDFLGLCTGETALLCLPVEYISGKMMVVRAMERGLQLFIVNPSSSPLKNLEHTVNFCAMTPLQVENSLEKIHFVEKIIIGGAAVSENLKEKIFRKLNKKPVDENQNPTIIYETFGMSETLSHIALKQIFPERWDCFQIFDGIEISTDERGCLRIYAPKLNPGILQTNDLVEIKNSKEFRFLGRIDNVINSGGAKIFPEELEAIVKKKLDAEVIFLGIPDEVLGERLAMIIEGKPSDVQLPAFEFKKTYHRPKEIIFVEKIPRLPNGKVDRISLKNLVLKK